MNIIKNNILGIIIGLIIASSIGITIAYQISANQISYEDTNVASAITDLYTMAETHCPEGKNCYESVLCDSSHHCSNQDSNLYVSEGDIITYGTESFRVISNDRTLIRLLAVYNLNVGDNAITTDPIGLQSENAYGITAPGDISGGIPFGIGGWNDSYWKDITDYTNSPYVYNNQSNLYQYVEAYKTKLQLDYGMQVIDATLLSVKEAQYLIGKYAWAYNQHYWTGSATDSHSIIDIRAGGYIRSDGYISDGYGIRPVIVIPISSL